MWLHVFMDFLNSYGVRLLMPFSERWFYGDALYIVDPILYVLFGGALVLGRRKAGSLADPTRIARRGLALAAAYMLVMLASNTWARVEVRAGLTRAGRPAETRFMVTPVFGNPVRREVLVDVGMRYEKGFLWFEPLPHFRPAGYGVDVNAQHPRARQAAATPVGQAYLRWSRFPFFVVQPRPGGGTRVQLNDYRYAGAGGRDTWLATTVDLPQ
jgi:inner membrane protein